MRRVNRRNGLAFVTSDGGTSRQREAALPRAPRSAARAGCRSSAAAGVHAASPIARRRAQRHGRHEPASRHQGRRRHPEAGRQCGRRRGRRRLRARRGAPRAGNLGGGGFMTIQLADGRKTFIDFRETAPLAATAEHVPRPRRQRRPRARAPRAISPPACPATSPGFELALARYGTMKRAAVMAPAIRLARRGFVLEQGDADLLAIAARDFREDPAAAAVFLDNGQPYAAGQRLVQKDLARTLERIAKHGQRRVLRRARSPTPSWRRARAAAASSPRPISPDTGRRSARR